MPIIVQPDLVHTYLENILFWISRSLILRFAENAIIHADAELLQAQNRIRESVQIQ